MPSKQERILKIIDELKGYLAKLKEAEKYDLEHFKKEWNIYFSIERLIQLSVECVIEVGEHLISLAKFNKPETYRETFEILEKEGVISSNLSLKLQGLVDFRNKLVHVYPSASLERIYKVYMSEIKAASEFIKIVKKFLQCPARRRLNIMRQGQFIAG
jgi:uncharacterized protein YutE (UPF0331/DUF86 family)